MKKFVIGMLMVGLLVAPAFAAGVYRLPSGQKAEQAATHVVKITYEDLTEDTDDTAQTLTTLNVGASMGVQLMSMVLVTPFDYTDDTNYTASTLLTVGDGTDLDLFLSSTELNEEGTEVYLKFGRQRTVSFATNVAQTTANFYTNQTDTTIAVVTNVTLTTVDFAESGTNVVTGVTIQTANVLSAVTAQTAAGLTASAVQTTTAITGTAQKLYTSADTVDFTFTPSANEALADCTSGEVWIYFRISDARNLTP